MRQILQVTSNTFALQEKTLQCLRKSEPVESEKTKAISQNCVDFTFSTYSATSQPRNRSRQALQTQEVSSIGILQYILLLLRCSPLPVLGFDMARFASVGLRSKIPVLNVSINRQEFIVFVQQSDNIASVSIQRGESPFDPSTSSSESSRLSQIICFRADKSIANRLLSTCLLLGETR